MARAIAQLRAAPTTVGALAMVAVFLAWQADTGGYAIASWVPGALLAAALLGLALRLRPGGWSGAPRGVQVALCALGGFTAWSYLSILWAGSQGDAWDGANRTLFYLLVFALLSLWRQRSDTAALVLGAWTVGLGVLALLEVLKVGSAGPGSHLFLGSRLADPAGYPNAAAGGWLLGLVPALVLSGHRDVAPWLRAILTAIAVLLLDTALLSQSRGSLYALPVVLVALFVLAPGRVRTLLALLLACAGAGAAAPAILRVGDQLTHAHTGAARGAALLGAALAGLLSGVVAWLERRRPLSVAAGRRAHTLLGRGAVALTCLGLVGGIVVAGDPAQRAQDAWHSFKQGYGQHSGSRLTSGLGSNRYDFYRVALNTWTAHPLRGVGADNFQVQYLRSGRSEETPRYPHSIELRTLTSTGLVGALLLLAAIGGALGAVAQALRRQDRLARGVAAGAAGAFVYWLAHGSFDWFWEWGGLGAPAWAMLGLACSLAPARPVSGRTRRPLWGLLAVAGLLAAMVSLALPWLAGQETDRALRLWPNHPGDAYASLRRAADLNPLSAQPYLLAGSIALRFGDLRRAALFFSQAGGRAPDDVYATLEQAAIASSQGRQADAGRLFARARRLAPRDPLIAQAAQLSQAGRRVDPTAVNAVILDAASKLARG